MTVEDILWEAFPEECGSVGVTPVAEIAANEANVPIDLKRPPSGQYWDITHSVEFLAAAAGLTHYLLELADRMREKGKEVTPEALEKTVPHEKSVVNQSSNRTKNLYIVIARNFKA